MKILIADDDAIGRLVVEKHVQSLGFEVTTATDGIECLKLYRAERPDVCIIDWMMPGMDGLEATKAIREENGGEFAYIIMLTARSQKEHMVAALRQGVDEFVGKPLDPIELEVRLGAAARLVEIQRSLAQQIEKAAALNDTLAHMNHELDQLASIDSLTGLLNRRVGLERIGDLIDIASRHGRPLSCAILDIDHFKRVNDTHGHAAGDRVLSDIAGVLNKVRRRTDIVTRFGGEEFIIAMPELTAVEARAGLERMNLAIANTDITFVDMSIRVTASIGVAALCEGESLKVLLGRADRAMYSAKSNGRNRVEVAESSSPADSSVTPTPTTHSTNHDSAA